VHPLPFESLSLDLQTAQAITGTDQAAGFVTAALPFLKGSWQQTQTNEAKVSSINTLDGGGELQSITNYKAAYAKVGHQMEKYTADAVTVYAQINEVLGPISPEVLPDGPRLQHSDALDGVPLPWTKDGYTLWRSWMKCEIADQNDCSVLERKPSVRELLARGADLMVELGPCPKPPDHPSPRILACLAISVQAEVAALSPSEQSKFADYLQALATDSSAILSADLAAVTAVNKDLGNYWANIGRSTTITPPSPLGEIPDPYTKNMKNLNLPKSLGRQVVFAVNAVNEVGTFAASVPAATARKSIVTITVLYADPKFETSAGVFFSTLPNRSFANQTMVTQNQGAPPTPGNVFIAQTIARPTVVPFAAGNYRLGPDYAWGHRRREAFYITGTVGLNPNTTTAEFGGGLSFSWRSTMVSALYDWGHDVRLTQGEYVGEVWCNMSAANPPIQKCSGPPPGPSTEKYWRGVFAVGLSVRIPSVFGGGAASNSGSH